MLVTYLQNVFAEMRQMCGNENGGAQDLSWGRSFAEVSWDLHNDMQGTRDEKECSPSITNDQKELWKY